MNKKLENTSDGKSKHTLEVFALKQALEAVRETTPLVHCITNYVTVNDCANILLAADASPIMSDEPKDVEDITSICGGLVLNIGTLNERSIEAMHKAGARAANLNHPIVLDPVGAGASGLRTQTAASLLKELPISVVRGNMSEIRALAACASDADRAFADRAGMDASFASDTTANSAENSGATRGVDVNPVDVVRETNTLEAARYMQSLARAWDAIVIATGEIDIVANKDSAFAIRNGNAMMGKITGTGCMLTCLVAAYVVANPDKSIQACISAVASAGIAGQIAKEHLSATQGTASFRTNFLDAISLMNGEVLEEKARVEELCLD